MKVGILLILVSLLETLAIFKDPFPQNHLILNYFKLRNVLSVTYYSCRSDNYKITKEFNNAKIPVIVLTTADEKPVLLTSKNGIIVDLSCDFVPDLMEFALENYLFREIISWIFIGSEGSANYELLFKSYIPLSSEVVLFSPVSPNDSIASWNIYSIYKVTKESEMIVKPILHQNLKYSEVSLKILNESNKRKNLYGAIIEAKTTFQNPNQLTQIDDLNMKHIDTTTKVAYQFLMNLALDLNFTYNLSKSTSYGSFVNGSFSGLMGNLERREIELGLLTGMIRKEYINVADFIADSFILRCPLIFRQPSLASVSNIYSLPFGMNVWRVFIGLILILILAQILLIATPMMKNEASFLDSMSFVLGAVCQQGFNRDSFVLSWRILHFVTFLSSMFLFASYSANIVALLQSPSNALRTISDVTHSNLIVQVEKYEYTHVIFEESTDPEVNSLFKKKIKPFGEKAFEASEEGMKKILTGRYAFLLEDNTAYKIISDTYTEAEKCGLEDIESIKLPPHAVPIVKNSSYRGIFRERLLWQKEVGHFDVIFKRWVSQKYKCEGNIGQLQSVDIKDCRYAFMIIACGSLVSVLFMVIEIAQKYFMNKKVNKNSAQLLLKVKKRTKKI